MSVNTRLYVSENEANRVEYQYQCAMHVEIYRNILLCSCVTQSCRMFIFILRINCIQTMGLYVPSDAEICSLQPFRLTTLVMLEIV